MPLTCAAIRKKIMQGWGNRTDLSEYVTINGRPLEIERDCVLYEVTLETLGEYCRRHPRRYFWATMEVQYDEAGNEMPDGNPELDDPFDGAWLIDHRCIAVELSPGDKSVREPHINLVMQRPPKPQPKPKPDLKIFDKPLGLLT